MIPDLLVSGVITLIASVVLGAWVVLWPDSRHSGAVILGLSGLLLLVGGGFGPPLLGLVVGLLAMRIDPTPSRPPGSATRRVARLWPWPLIVAASCFLGLFPGTALLYAAGLDSDALVSALTVGAFAATGLAVWSARGENRVLALPGPGPGGSPQEPST